jgi:hypothetical protein
LPTTARPENHIVRIFVSAYEKGSWKDAILTFPDEHQDGGIDGLAVRADGGRLAVEHTVVEPFAGDIADQSEMLPLLATIEADPALAVPGLWIQLFVPVGTLHLQKPPVRHAVAKAVHGWLRDNRLRLTPGNSERLCLVAGTGGKPDFEITLTLKVVALAGEGSLHVRRQQVANTLGDVIERMLTKKLPKLVNTPATRRVLLLERRHMNLMPKQILDEIERCRPSIPALNRVDEIWIVETMFFGTDFGGNYIRFELFENGVETSSYDFEGEQLLTRYEDGFAEVVHHIGG